MSDSKNLSRDELKPSHTPSAIRKRLDDQQHNYVKDFIYGAIDGTVTTFAVVSGVAGAALSQNIVLILGMTNLIADGFSMAVSNFLGTRAEEQMRHQARKTEEMHIRKIPEGEREEVRQIFAAKGFQGEELNNIVTTITSNHQQWIDTMLTEELGLPLKGANPMKAALATFAAFVVVGAVPILPFLISIFFKKGLDPFMMSTVMTGMAFFIVGTLKAQFVGRKWYLAGLETFFIGGAAAVLAYIVGVLLKGIVGH
jgi:VIT1/CCC1 family predicted Fe2+/Mn2+ transporter